MAEEMAVRSRAALRGKVKSDWWLEIGLSFSTIHSSLITIHLRENSRSNSGSQAVDYKTKWSERTQEVPVVEKTSKKGSIPARAKRSGVISATQARGDLARPRNRLPSWADWYQSSQSISETRSIQRFQPSPRRK